MAILHRHRVGAATLWTSPTPAETAYLKLDNGGYWWYCYGSDYEAMAEHLRASGED